MKSINPLYKADEFGKRGNFSQPLPNLIRSVLSNETPDQAADLIERLLEYEPEMRITAKEALDHPYFNELKETS